MYPQWAPLWSLVTKAVTISTWRCSTNKGGNLRQTFNRFTTHMHETKQETTGKRDLKFSQWIRDHLPPSREAFMVSDLDFILWNYKNKKMMFIEVKTNSHQPYQFQRIMFNHIAKWIKAGLPQCNDGWQFLGYHEIVFERKHFDDGQCWLNHQAVTEQELISFLSSPHQ